MVKSKSYGMFKEWALSVMAPLRRFLSWLQVVCILTADLLLTVIAKVFYGFCGPFVTTFGLMDTKSRPTRFMTCEATHESKASVQTTNSIDIPKHSGVCYWTRPGELSTGGQGQANYGDLWHEEPAIFSLDEELDQGPRKDEAETVQDETAGEKRKTTMAYRSGGYGDGGNKDKFTCKTLNMAKTMQLRNTLRQRAAFAQVLKQCSLRTQRILFTYSTGSLLLTTPSKLRHEICLFMDDEDIKENIEEDIEENFKEDMECAAAGVVDKEDGKMDDGPLVDTGVSEETILTAASPPPSRPMNIGKSENTILRPDQGQACKTLQLVDTARTTNLCGGGELSCFTLSRMDIMAWGRIDPYSYTAPI
ncbi:uncharacterized protein SPSK_04405 [Sporothrix schenckii 1099-18]|uniref:Uncharacterized protein n=1 Tax=Sporothrix schenckii 1099-18 TaxID=1397361 RepID=A0A0F2M023_SPOSC|nr:uncharacterized protein SPSK_04405 [Sporothrix schenckii 1099-18]KJR83052.1 hypothetical protein SPSK_04405 [Sporothrix schenckii 1099-18]